ncbi:MAG: hypothetical protein ACYDCA_01090 [Candidatus Tyrphobacter sp.]
MSTPSLHTPWKTGFTVAFTAVMIIILALCVLYRQQAPSLVPSLLIPIVVLLFTLFAFVKASTARGAARSVIARGIGIVVAIFAAWTAATLYLPQGMQDLVLLLGALLAIAFVTTRPR